MVSPTDLVNSYDPQKLPSTNLERWLNYTQSIESPNSYIIFGLISVISAALQRRVWIPHGVVNCYPNMFIALVGRASLGKGMTITPVKSLIKDHDYGNGAYDTGIFRKIGEVVEKENMMTVAGSDSFEDDSLFPIPADSSSLRALTHYMSVNSRSCYYIDSHTKKKRCYLHSSAYLMLEEIVSLLKSGNETKHMVDYLVQVWDANDYKHMTFGYGTDLLKNTCVSILAGTTPDSMERLFTEDLLREGVASRTIFIYEEDQRFRRWPGGGINDTQRESLKYLRNHIFNLSRLCGEVHFSPEAESMVRKWYEEQMDLDRVNHNVKLDPYYGRKKVHLMKLSMAIHFMESLDYIIQPGEVQLAMDLLRSVELTMHKALRTRNRNDLSTVARKLISYLKSAGPSSVVKIWMDFYEDFKSREELLTTLQNLKMLGQIEEVQGQPVKYKTKTKV